MLILRFLTMVRCPSLVEHRVLIGIVFDVETALESELRIKMTLADLEDL